MAQKEEEEDWLEERMLERLDQRAKKGSLRVYLDPDDENAEITRSTPSVVATDTPTGPILLDFSSNDYLGLARDPTQRQRVESRYRELLDRDVVCGLGSTGSRLLSGDSGYARQLELRLAQWHRRPAALLFNSGYDANLSILSCLPCDRFVFDEYAHNSLRMGMRLASTRRRNNNTVQQVSFQHNNLEDLHRILKLLRGQTPTPTPTKKMKLERTLIVVESVYSMDGDVAPLRSILEMAQTFGALVLVDEAHGLGIVGDDSFHNSRGLGTLAQLNLESHPALVCSIHTFGKAAGCHGAVACGSKTLRQYLWNYGWPLVYSTSLPLHSLVAIECSYETMTSPRGKELREHTQRLVQLFRKLVQERILNLQPKTQMQGQLYLLPSKTPIQALVLTNNGNQACTEFCDRVWGHSSQTIRLYPIKSPTVPIGMERIRIILHGHNKANEVRRLVECMLLTLIDMNLVTWNQAARL